jgi:hypothetical protein
MNELEQQLAKFLAAAESERDEGITLRALRDGLARLTNQQAAHEQKNDLQWVAHDAEHRSLRLRLEHVEDKQVRLEEVDALTGRHAIVAEERATQALSRAKSLPPVLQFVNFIGTKLGERWALHMVFATLGLAMGWLVHLLHLFK